MTLLELKNLLMIQTGNDVEDYTDYSTQALAYLNEGYRRVYKHWMGAYPDTALVLDTDIPALPAYVHPAIADWATWLMYRNGNPSKQNRGYVFRKSAEAMISTIPHHGGMTEEQRLSASRFTGLYDA